MKIYLATSWRNERYPIILQKIRSHPELECYDFKNPDAAFHWSDIDPEWEQWGVLKARAALQHSLCRRGFDADMSALKECDALVLLQPCGKSAHLEAGYAIGAVNLFSF